MLVDVCEVVGLCHDGFARIKRSLVLWIILIMHDNGTVIIIWLAHSGHFFGLRTVKQYFGTSCTCEFSLDST